MTLHLPMTINGRDAETAATIDVINPATGNVLGNVPDAGAAELDAAIAAARAAFPAWSRLPYAERQAKVAVVGQVIADNAPELIRLLTQEQGKPVGQAEVEIGGAAQWAPALASMDIPVEVVEDTPEHRVETRYVPIGVVGAISPWNFPVMLSVWKIAPALLAGNTMVLKPSPFTPFAVLRLAQLLRGVLPDGVLNVITGGDALGPMMTSHPGFDKISFTGSTATGRQVMSSAAPTLKRITLELGGNDAAIVMPDVDVPSTAEALFWSSFGNSGQICVATKRAYIHEDIYEPMKAALSAIAAAVPMGPASEQGSVLGPIQNKLQFQRVKGLIEDCEANGYDLIRAGTAPVGNGYFVPVTFVDNPPEASRIVQEEQFGPVLPLIKFRDLEDVIDRANASDYGLAGSVWSNDETLALEIADRLETGTVWINEAQALTPFTVFGGHKQSGLGRENGLAGLLEFTNAKTITVKRSVKQT